MYKSLHGYSFNSSSKNLKIEWLGHMCLNNILKHRLFSRVVVPCTMYLLTQRQKKRVLVAQVFASVCWCKSVSFYLLLSVERLCLIDIFFGPLACFLVIGSPFSFQNYSSPIPGPVVWVGLAPEWARDPLPPQ